MGKVRFGLFKDASGVPETLRYSTVLKKLQAAGESRGVNELLLLKASLGSKCPLHGELEDPIVGIYGEGANRQIAFICPHCSGPAIYAAWVAEGKREQS